MLSAKLGHFLDVPLKPLAKHIPFSPNFLTITGFLLTTLAAIILTVNLKLGGVLIALGGIFDMLDGIVARTTGRQTKFGAFLDSVLDRYSDAFLFLSLAYYLAARADHGGAFLSLGTLVGALLVSYTRARAEGLGESCHIGIMERPERILLLIFATITGWIVPVLWILFVLTHITVIQRIFHVRKSTRRK
jgi:phosphatidylglycerophosphate synthase